MRLTTARHASCAWLPPCSVSRKGRACQLDHQRGFAREEQGRYGKQICMVLFFFDEYRPARNDLQQLGRSLS